MAVWDERDQVWQTEMIEDEQYDPATKKVDF